MMSSVRLWHSALLFILALDLSVRSQDLILSPANFRIIWDDSAGGHRGLHCRPPLEYSDMKTNDFSFQWRLDGDIVEAAEKEFLSFDQLDNVTLVECWASNALGTSYAFLNLVSNQTER